MVSTQSRVLYDVVAGVYAGLGFDVLEDAVFRDLVIARVVEPTSILDTGRVLRELGSRPASEKTMRRTLERSAGGKVSWPAGCGVFHPCADQWGCVVVSV